MPRPKKRSLIPDEKKIELGIPVKPKTEPKPREPHKKYSDGRRNNGAVKGVSRGQGRKPKAKEADIKNFALGSKKRAFGSEKKAWEALAEMSKESFAHLRLLWEYKYGKPKEQKDINVKQEINIPVISFLQPEETIDIESTEVKDEEDKS